MYLEEVYLSDSQGSDCSQSGLEYVLDESYSSDCENFYSIKMIHGTKI